jgi:molecular chaperone GrpE
VRGYLLNERLMRPALVVVARAPEKAEPAASTTPGSGSAGGTASDKSGNTPGGSL